MLIITPINFVEVQYKVVLYANRSISVRNASVIVLIAITAWLYTLLASSKAIVVVLSSLISPYKIQYTVAWSSSFNKVLGSMLTTKALNISVISSSKSLSLLLSPLQSIIYYFICSQKQSLNLFLNFSLRLFLLFLIMFL